jgi:hypothetical protein
MNKIYYRISKNLNKSLQTIEAACFKFLRFDLSNVSVNKIWFYTVKMSKKDKE